MLIFFTAVKANTNSDTVYTYYDAARNKYVLKLTELQYIAVNKKAQTNKNIKPNATVEISSKNKTINFILIAASTQNISISNCLK